MICLFHSLYPAIRGLETLQAAFVKIYKNLAIIHEGICKEFKYTFNNGTCSKLITGILLQSVILTFCHQSLQTPVLHTMLYTQAYDVVPRNFVKGRSSRLIVILICITHMKVLVVHSS